MKCLESDCPFKHEIRGRDLGWRKRDFTVRMVGSVRGEENISPDGWGQEELAKRGLRNKDHGKTMLTLADFQTCPSPFTEDVRV